VKTKNAYLTVEAAFIFPLIIGITMALLFLTFFLSANVRAKCEIDRIILEQERLNRDGEGTNTGFFRKVSDSLDGYLLVNTAVSKCFCTYGNYEVECFLSRGAKKESLPGADFLSNIMRTRIVRTHKSDSRVENARYLAVGKSVYTKVKGYATGWRNTGV